MSEIKTLNLDHIRIDGSTQSRVLIDEQVVAEYAELYRSGVTLPPVTVFFDGTTHWLADGFHRYWANRRINCDYVYADVRQGTQRDAILYSVGANADHGLQRTNADKRKAVLMMLNDGEWSAWPHTDIAQACGVSREYVCRLANSMSASCDRSQDEVREVSRAGKKYPQNTAKIGRANKPRKSAGIVGSEMNPIRQPRPALARTSLPHDPVCGARAIVSAMGIDYALRLIQTLTSYLQHQKAGDP